MSSSQLNPNEEVIMEGKINWVFILPHVILSFLTSGVWLIVLLYFVIVRSKTKMTLTNRRFIGVVGSLFSSDVMDIPLHKVTSVSVVNSFLGKILGYATLRVASSSGTFDFDGVNRAFELRNAISEQMDKFEQERIQQQASAMAQALKQ